MEPEGPNESKKENKEKGISEAEREEMASERRSPTPGLRQLLQCGLVLVSNLALPVQVIKMPR